MIKFPLWTQRLSSSSFSHAHICFLYKIISYLNLTDILTWILLIPKAFLFASCCNLLARFHVWDLNLSLMKEIPWQCLHVYKVYPEENFLDSTHCNNTFSFLFLFYPLNVKIEQIRLKKESCQHAVPKKNPLGCSTRWFVCFFIIILSKTKYCNSIFFSHFFFLIWKTKIADPL